MKKTNIKHALSNTVAMLMAVLVFSACLSSDDTEKSSECAILSFSVGSITSSVVTKKYDSQGNARDTIVSRTIAGTGIYFNIDQLNGYIYNVDSLPNWVSLEKVVPSFSCYGNVYGKVVEGDDYYYPLTSGSDSLNFSKTVELMCLSTDGTAARYYQVNLYKRQTNTDTLEWAKKTSDLAIEGPSKALCTDDKVFVFSQNTEGDFIVTFANSDDATAWSVPVAIPVDFNSVVLFQGAFYGLGTDGHIYRSTPDQLAATWTQAAELPVERLLAADDFYLYAYDGEAIIGSPDLTTWSVQGVTDLEMLPEHFVNNYAYTSNTNESQNQVVMTGISTHNSDNGVTWYKVSSKEEATNQQWAYIQVTPDNPYGLPHLDNLSVTYYKKALFAIGAEAGKYQYLYRSDDNGITWHPQTAMYPTPQTLDAALGAASIVAVDKQLWIIQENGTVWQGSIQ